MLTSVFVSAPGSKRKFRMDHIHTIKGLDLPTQSINIDRLKEKFPYLNGIPIASQNNVKSMILIGLEHANLIASLETRTGRSR